MELYVAPDGNDSAPGTLDAPLGSLKGARDRVRSLIGDSEESIDVIFRGGIYPVHETVAFTLADAPGEGRTVTYKAYPGETPVVSGGHRLAGWLPPSDLPHSVLSLLPEAARGNVWSTELPVEPSDRFIFNSLFAGDRRLARARGEGFAFMEDDTIPDRDWWDTCRVPEGAVADWPDLANAELVVIPRFTWTMNILGVKEFDPGTGLLRTANPCTYFLRPNRRPETVWVENVVAVLTRPGTWVADYQSGRLYYWPVDSERAVDLVVPAVTEIIRIEGEIDYDGPADRVVTGIHFEGLKFSHGGRYPFHGQTGWGMQHDWEAFDRPTAMVRLRGASGISFRRCEFAHSDGTALRLDLTAQDNVVEDCLFDDVGGSAISLCGYGPGTKDTNKRNRIVNNLVRNTGIVTWHSPGIFVWQSGENHIAHNHIHHTPYTGIVVSGRIRLNRIDQTLRGVARPGVAECFNTIRWSEIEPILGSDYEMPVWHDPNGWKADWDRRKGLLHCRNNVIEYNDIHDVMQIMGDGNGVYISGTGAGNVVRFNAVHDCPSDSMAEALRCDDDQHETTLHGNLIYRIGGMATGITIKGANTITNNIIALPLSRATARGLISLEVGPLDGTVVRRNILLTDNPEQSFYFQYRRIHGEGPPPLLRDCDADVNLYWCSSAPEEGEKHLAEERQYGIEAASISADPVFVDAAANDFRLDPSSPAFDLGFEEFDFDRIGIQRGPVRDFRA